MYNYLCAVALALTDQEFRQRLQVAMQAGNLIAADDETGGERPAWPDIADRFLPAGGRVFAFGPFLLLPSRRLLLEGNANVHLGSRAFDILTILVERAGEVVGKDELLARVWPNVFVDDGNLKTQVSMLRRALGEGRGARRYIATVPGRGYHFVAPLSLADGPVRDRPGPERGRTLPDVIPAAA